MAPKRAKTTRASTFNDAIPSYPALPTMMTTIATKVDDEHTTPNNNTPERNPAKRAAGITQAQKQALIDNLQLESRLHTRSILTTVH